MRASLLIIIFLLGATLWSRRPLPAPARAPFDTPEIADRWNVIQAELLETFCQLSHAIGVHAPRLVQMRVIAERGQCRRLGDAVDVVRLAHTVEDVGNRRTGYDTTDPADGHDGQ